MPMRVSQLAFTADESYLVLSAETGGGLAVYDVQAIQNGSVQPIFELSTNGESLRALVVNPMADKAELCALVTSNGHLLMADLQQRSMRNGPNGQPVLRSQVSCAAWSSRGKQLVAGCTDGTIYQMTPDGQEKAHLPKPPQLGDYYVATISWLENDVFLVVHNPTSPGNTSAYHIVTRGKAGTTPEFLYQKLNDPIEPFSDKTPFHTILRLRDFPPNLQDMLLVASTAVENIGLITRSKVPLATDVPAEKITNVFTTTELADDSKRAQMPMTADFTDTFPIGVALDLSSAEKVQKPIPGDEINESQGPLPGLWALNNEGVLLAWWVIYNDAIREGATFPGLVALGGGDSTQPASTLSSSKLTAPAFAATAPGLTHSWAQAPGTSPAASPSRAPAFGSPSVLGTSGFGATSGLGANSSPWKTAARQSVGPAFGESSFGSAPSFSAMNPTDTSSKFAIKSSAAPFGSTMAPSNTASGASPFGALSGSTSGFAALGAGTSGGGSIFASKSGTNNPSPFVNKGSNIFGATSNNDNNGSTMFSAPAGNAIFGSSPFVLGTTFKADPASNDDKDMNDQKSGGSFGGGLGGFGLSLSDTVKGEPGFSDQKDENMDAPTPAAPTPSATEPANSTGSFFESTTPTTTPAPAGSRFYSPLTSNDSPAPTALFGKPSATPMDKTPMFSEPRENLFSGKPSEPAASSADSPFDSPFAKSPPKKSAENIASAPSLFSRLAQASSKPAGVSSSDGSIFGQPSGKGGLSGSLEKPTDSPSSKAAKQADERKVDSTKKSAETAEEAETEPGHGSHLPLPPDTISKDPYPLGDSSPSLSSSISTVHSIQIAQSTYTLVTQLPSNKVVEEEVATLPPTSPDSFSSKTSEPSTLAEPPLPPDPTARKFKKTASTEPPLPPDPFIKPKAKAAVANPAGVVAEEAPLPPIPFQADNPFKTDKAKSKSQATEAAGASAPASGLFGNLKTSATSGLFDKNTSSKPTSGMSIFSNPALANNDSGHINPFANLKPPPSATTEESDEDEDEDEDEDDDEDEDEEEEEVDGDDEHGEGVENDFEEEDDDNDENEDLGFEEGEESEEDDEGSGTDVGKDLSRSTSGNVQSPSFNAHDSFTNVNAGDASASSTFSHLDGSRQQLFGEPPALPAPRQDTSPRSPSPQRPLAKTTVGIAGRLVRKDGQRSFSSPSTATRPLRHSPRLVRTKAGGAVAAERSGGSSTTLASRRQPRDANQEEQRKANEARAAAEAKEVEQEDSYDILERELDQPLAPTQQLAECMYILDSDINGGDTVASQVEAVYRDINRMVLVLKVNSRNIDAYLRGQSQVDRKTEEDLDDADGWVMCDVDALGAIVSRDLPTKLRQSRVKSESEILADSETLLKDASRLQVMHDDIVRAIQLQADPDHLAAARALPLGTEQATQQNDLRRTFTEFMARVVEAEQQLVLLRTKIAALAATSAGSSGTNGRASPVPTVDAVMRTIARMTAMAEKRSVDIDVLEAQIRKLNMGSRNAEASPFSTPQKQQHKRNSLMFAPSGSAQRSIQRSSVFSPSSPGLSAPGTPTRKKLAGYSETEKDQLRQKRLGRQRTLDRLQKIQQAEGPRYMPMDE